MTVAGVTAIVRLQPSSVARETCEPLIARIVIAPLGEPRPLSRPRPLPIPVAVVELEVLVLLRTLHLGRRLRRGLGADGDGRCLRPLSRGERDHRDREGQTGRDEQGHPEPATPTWRRRPRRTVDDRLDRFLDHDVALGSDTIKVLLRLRWLNRSARTLRFRSADDTDGAHRHRTFGQPSLACSPGSVRRNVAPRPATGSSSTRSPPMPRISARDT